MLEIVDTFRKRIVAGWRGTGGESCKLVYRENGAPSWIDFLSNGIIESIARTGGPNRIHVEYVNQNAEK